MNKVMLIILAIFVIEWGWIWISMIEEEEGKRMGSIIQSVVSSTAVAVKMYSWMFSIIKEGVVR